MRGHFYQQKKGWGFTIDIGKDEKGKRLQKRYSGFKTKKEAEKACANAITELEKGTFVTPKDFTVASYLRDWLAIYKQNIAPNTYNGYRVNIENHIIPIIGHIKLQELQPLHVERMYVQLLIKEDDTDSIGTLSASSIRYVHATLRKALNDAYKKQYVVRNVTEMVTVPRGKTFKAKFLEQEQVTLLLNALKGTQIFLPTLLAVGLGLRRGEVLGLQWKDIDLKTGFLTVNRSLTPVRGGYKLGDTKTEDSNKPLAIPKSLLINLKQTKLTHIENKLYFGQAYQDLDFVCENPDGSPLSPHTWQHAFKRALEKASLPDLRLHDLRHTNASLMLKNGVNMKVVSERLRHSKIGITMDIYTHIDTEQQKDAAQKIDDVIDIYN